MVVHATTVVTNALIERKGPPTALLVTEGFRDILYIRNEHRYEMYDPQIEFPEPLVSRELTFGIAERVLATGDAQPRCSAGRAHWSASSNAKASFRSPSAFSTALPIRRTSARWATSSRKRAPELFVTLSSDVAPQIREYPRASTAAINAYTMPITQPYLDALRDGLQQARLSRTRR